MRPQYGVSTVRESRRGHEDDVNLARGNQYSTGPASASHSFSTKLQLGKKEKRWRLTFAECLQAEIPRVVPAAGLLLAGRGRATASSSAVSDELNAQARPPAVLGRSDGERAAGDPIGLPLPRDVGYGKEHHHHAVQ